MKIKLYMLEDCYLTSMLVFGQSYLHGVGSYNYNFKNSRHIVFFFLYLRLFTFNMLLEQLSGLENIECGQHRK